MVSKNNTLIIGGARSGKSRFSEQLALETGLEPVYIATSEVRDDEMRARIELHRQSRDAKWRTIEEPLNLSAIIAQQSSPERVLLVDCLTLWLSNHLEHQSNIPNQISNLCAALNAATGPVVLVSNETGQGIVPINELARTFRDEAGRLNQAVAAVANNVFVVMAGLTLPLKTNDVPMGPKIL